MRSRMEVLASDPAEAVLCAGGLICDRAMAGWDVEVLIPGGYDGRALAILGAGVAELASAPDSAAIWPPMLKITAPEGIRGDFGVLTYVCEPVGDAAETGPYRRRGFQHTLSVAARAFKAHALAAAHLDTTVRAVEFFNPAIWGRGRPATVQSVHCPPIALALGGSDDGGTLD